MNDAAYPRDDIALEILPPDLLPIHQRLEHDGGSWRASLPAPDTLLHRIQAGSTQDAPAQEDRAAFLPAARRVSPPGVSPSMSPRPIVSRPRSRRKAPPR